MSYKSLIINPGSTSTKIGVFEDETLLFEETLRHTTEEIAQYGSIFEQKDFRKEADDICRDIETSEHAAEEIAFYIAKQFHVFLFFILVY